MNIYQAALDCQDGSNSCGIARLLTEVMSELCDAGFDTEMIQTDSAVYLIIEKLAELNHVGFGNTSQYAYHYENCKMLAIQYSE